MKYRSKLINTMAIAISLTGLHVGKANAVIIVLFEEVGNDVQAKVTGSLDLSTATFFVNNSNQLTSDSHSAGSSTLNSRVVGVPSYDTYIGGSVNLTSLSGAISSWSGSETFGYDGAAIYVPHDTAINEPNFSPTGTWTWTNSDLNDIGMSSLTETPQVVYTTLRGDTIQFALAPVPEPSSMALLGLGCLSFAFRRSRR